jgi:hypothetical protein
MTLYFDSRLVGVTQQYGKVKMAMKQAVAFVVVDNQNVRAHEGFLVNLQVLVMTEYASTVTGQ